MSKETISIPLKMVTDPNFVPKIVKVLGKKVVEEPLAEIDSAWVHRGNKKVIFKFGDDNRKYCMKPEIAKEFAEALLRCARAVDLENDPFGG